MIETLILRPWPLLACLLLPGILVYYGLHIVRREVIFVDLALAQVAALGICLALRLGHEAHEWQTYGWALGFTIIGAAIFTATRTHDRRVPQEALIGVVYVVAASAAILILSDTAEGSEELKRTMVGDILLVQPGEVLRAFGLYFFIGLVHFVFRRKFLTITFEPEKAAEQGISVRWWDFLFYVLFGFVVTSFVHIGGVLMIFSYLIVPALCANLLGSGMVGRLAIGWGIATLSSLGGLVFAYQKDLPVGASIVCALGVVLVLIVLVARYTLGRKFGFTGTARRAGHGEPGIDRVAS